MDVQMHGCMDAQLLACCSAGSLPQHHQTGRAEITCAHFPLFLVLLSEPCLPLLFPPLDKELFLFPAHGRPQEMSKAEQLTLDTGESTVRAAGASADTAMGLGAWPRNKSTSIIRNTRTHAMPSYIYLRCLHAAGSIHQHSSCSMGARTTRERVPFPRGDAASAAEPGDSPGLCVHMQLGMGSPRLQVPSGRTPSQATRVGWSCQRRCS